MASSPAVTSLLLYVGDDEQLVREASTTLSAEKYDVSVVAVDSPEDARRRLEQGDVDCLVYEDTVVTGSGFPFLSEIHEQQPDLRTLYLTERDEHVDEALAAGASDVLVRRTGVETVTLLTRRLNNVLSRKNDHGESRSESQLRREQDFSGLILDTLDDVFYLVNPAGELERWNERFGSVTGYTDEEIDGMRALDFFEGADQRRVANAIAETLETGSSDVEAEFVTKDGEGITYHFSGAKLTDPDGTLRGLVGIGRDVSERNERIEKLEQIRRNVSEVVWLSTPGEDSMDFISDSYENVWGRPPESLLENSESFVEAIHPDDRERVSAARHDQKTSPDDYDQTYRVVQPDGEVRWVHERSSAVREDGELTRIVGVASDVTEKTEYQAELDVRNRAIAEAPIGITIHDLRADSQPVIYANTSFRKLTGYEQDSIEGSSIELLAGPDTDPEKLATLETAFARSESASTVALLYRADGTPFWGQVTVAPVTNESGEGDHFVGFLQDVTETKEHAEKIERRLQEFSEILAEELRAPLQQAEQSIQTVETDESATELAAAERSIQQVDKLIDDLVTVHSFSVKSRDIFETAPSEDGEEK